MSSQPLLMAWINATKKRRKARDAERYGLKTAEDKKEGTVESSGGEPSAPAAKAEIPTIERKLKGKRKKK